MEARYKQLLKKYLSEHKDNFSDKWSDRMAVMEELEREKTERLNAEWQLRLEDALQKQRQEFDRLDQERLAQAIKEVFTPLGTTTNSRLENLYQ